MLESLEKFAFEGIPDVHGAKPTTKHGRRTVCLEKNIKHTNLRHLGIEITWQMFNRILFAFNFLTFNVNEIICIFNLVYKNVWEEVSQSKTTTRNINYAVKKTIGGNGGYCC